MYTETELRDMLRASADRVPAEEAAPAACRLPEERMTTALAPRPRRQRRRVLAPIAVAAATAAVVAGAVALTQRPNARSAPTAEPSRAVTTHVAPAVRATRAAAPAHPTLTTPVVDAVRIDTANETENYIGVVDGDHGQQVITSQLDHDRAINLVIAPSSAFDDSAVPRTHPVAIGGTTGHYAVLRLFPLSAGGKGGSAPTGTIVFRTPDGHWAFAWLQAGTKDGNAAGTPVNDPAAIVNGFDTLHASFAAGTGRTPLRVGYLPAGAAFDDADLDTAHSKLVVASLTTEANTKQTEQLDIDLLAPSPTSGGTVDGKDCFPHAGCVQRRHRDLPGGFVLIVNGTGYSGAVVQKVLDSITVAADPDDVSTYFLLTEAIG